MEALLGLADQPVVARGAGIDEGSRNREVVELAEAFLELLDGVGNSLRRGRYPEKAAASKVATVLRAIADDIEA